MKKNKKLYLLIVLMALIAVVLFIAIDRRNQPASSNEYVIGAIVPLSGAGAQLGIHTKQGMELFIEKNRQILDKYLLLGVEDNKSNPKDGINAFQNLMTKSKSKPGMVVTQLSGVAAAVGPMADDSDVVQFGLAATPSLLKSKLSVRNYVSAERLGKEIANLLISKEASNANLLILNDEYGLAIANSFYSAAEGKIVINDRILFESNNKEISVLVEKAVASKPNAIVVAGFGTAPIQCIQRLREIGYNGIVVCDPAAAVESYRKLLAGEGMDYYVVDLLFPDPSNVEQMNFMTSYMDKFGIKPDLPAAVAYAGCEVFAKAASQASSLNPKPIIEKCTNGFELETILGKTSVKERDIQYPLCIKKVSGNSEPKIEKKL